MSTFRARLRVALLSAVALALSALLLSGYLSPEKTRVRARERDEAEFKSAIAEARAAGSWFPKGVFRVTPEPQFDYAVIYATQFRELGFGSLLLAPENEAYRFVTGTHQVGPEAVIDVAVFEGSAKVNVFLICNDVQGNEVVFRRGHYQRLMPQAEVDRFRQTLESARFWSAGSPNYRLRVNGEAIPWRPWLAVANADHGYQLVSPRAMGAVQARRVEIGFTRAAGHESFGSLVAGCGEPPTEIVKNVKWWWMKRGRIVERPSN